MERELNCVYCIGSTPTKDVADRIQNFSIRVNLKYLDPGLDLSVSAPVANLGIVIDSPQIRYRICNVWFVIKLFIKHTVVWDVICTLRELMAFNKVVPCYDLSAFNGAICGYPFQTQTLENVRTQ